MRAYIPINHSSHPSIHPPIHPSIHSSTHPPILLFTSPTLSDTRDPNTRPTDKPKPKKKKRPAPSSFASAAAAASLPVRRSTRQRGPPLSSYSDIDAAAAAAAMEEEAEPEPPEEEVDYDDSTVLKYLCCASSSSLPAAPSAFFGSKGQGGGSKTSSDDTGPLKGFRVHSSPGPALCDPALSAVYSLHLQPPTAPASGAAAPLLAAGAFVCTEGGEGYLLLGTGCC